MSEITFDSKEEWYFSWYLHELQQAGYIKFWKYQPKSFPLSEVVKFGYTKQLKTKVKHLEGHLLAKHHYQADFLISWSISARNIFFFDLQGKNPMQYPFMTRFREKYGHQSIIDIKGTFNRDESWTKFSINQKWVWQKYNIYIQKIIPTTLFQKTFTPARYLLTDKKTKRRKFKYTPISLHQFINE